MKQPESSQTSPPQLPDTDPSVRRTLAALIELRCPTCGRRGYNVILGKVAVPSGEVGLKCDKCKCEVVFVFMPAAPH